jgi:hypothetical protein
MSKDFLREAQPSDVSRRVPEAALAVGALLSATFVAFVLLTQRASVLAGTRWLLTLAVAVALLYPFAVWAVVHSEDPTWALPPRVVAGVAGAVGAVALLGGTLRGAALFGVSAALLVALPPAAYWLSAPGTRRVSPRPLLAGVGAAAVGVVVLGVVVEGPLLAAVDALALFLPAVAYHVRADGRRLPLAPTLAAGAAGAAAVGGVAVVVAASTYATLASVTTVAMGAVLGAYVTALR